MNRIKKNIAEIIRLNKIKKRKSRKRGKMFIWMRTATDSFFTDFHSVFSMNIDSTIGFVIYYPKGSFSYTLYQNNEEGC